ncbi:DUF3500 domain-containing protein [Pedobacter sp. B4-66]|uniref:DUF3500 domain-containing protein n=1 Tax=Pedobacter sp. B4-66 TaxID=2817280 RepID=UPI001BDA1630|nr:DUF3500 domain-containing protein [Pedobacter sp. B4-66]
MKKSRTLFCILFVLVCGLNTKATSIKTVLSTANTFIESLNTDQQKAAVISYTKESATKWTNLPCGLQCRVGVLLGSLTDKQLRYAKEVVKAAMGTLPSRGYDQAMQILAADGFLGTNRSGYSSGNYIIAFLGKPSATSKWQLQLGGHHLAVNLTFDNGKVISASPLFIGLEPKNFTANGVTYSPLKANHDSLVAMIASLNSEQLEDAKLSAAFGDVSVGPGADGKFPDVKAGLKVGKLNKQQKAMVIEAIKVWAQIADDATAKKLIATYSSEIDSTYIAYSGNPMLINKTDYVRIDGPSVWIEFICQPGAVFPAEVHYHTVYRDHIRDYGGSFSFSN